MVTHYTHIYSDSFHPIKLSQNALKCSDPHLKKKTLLWPSNSMVWKYFPDQWAEQYLQKWDDERSQWEVCSFLQFGMKFFNCQSRVLWEKICTINTFVPWKNTETNQLLISSQHGANQQTHIQKANSSLWNRLTLFKKKRSYIISYCTTYI